MPQIAADDQIYIPVAVATLAPATVTPFSLFLRVGREYRLYRDADFPFDADARAELQQRGVLRLYVANDDLPRYKAYLRTHLDDVLADESLPTRERLGWFDEVVRNVLQEDFARGDADRIVHSAQALAEQAVQAVCRSGAVAGDLLSVMHHDYQTFTHSANVSYLSVLLASRLGLPADDLQLIGVGALLHDLGKLQIPERILNKNGRLDVAELAVVQRHPTSGFEALCRRADLSWGQLMMVYQHHEGWCGGGYPVGSVGDEIHLWARLCTVADVFDALTSDRPYRRGMRPTEALELMGGRMRDKFDPELLSCFQAAIPRN